MSDSIEIVVVQNPVQAYVEIIQEIRIVPAVFETASFDFLGSDMDGNSMTLPHVYKVGSVRLYKNGARQNTASVTESGADTITVNLAILPDDEFITEFEF